MWLFLYCFDFFYSFGVECRSCSLSMDHKSLDVKSEYTGLLFDNLCLFQFEVSFTFYSCNWQIYVVKTNPPWSQKIVIKNDNFIVSDLIPSRGNCSFITLMVPKIQEGVHLVMAGWQQYKLLFMQIKANQDLRNYYSIKENFMKTYLFNLENIYYFPSCSYSGVPISLHYSFTSC